MSPSGYRTKSRIKQAVEQLSTRYDRGKFKRNANSELQKAIPAAWADTPRRRAVAGWNRRGKVRRWPDMPVFFCEPYSPLQPGSNEKLNGLVRQFLPKGTDLSTVTPQKLAYMEAMFNDRPHKILNL